MVSSGRYDLGHDQSRWLTTFLARWTPSMSDFAHNFHVSLASSVALLQFLCFSIFLFPMPLSNILDDPCLGDPRALASPASKDGMSTLLCQFM